MNPALNFRHERLAAGLYLVGVPIGAARDITLRALDVLASADRLAAEDTRSLRKLMDIHGIPLKGRRIVALHDHSAATAVARLLDAIAEGESVAFASEAGMPLIADPGFELVRAARARKLPVTAAPGPTAVATALAIGGLATDAFHFAGFLPSARGARRSHLRVLAEIEATLVLYEAPHRLAATLEDAADALGGDRAAVICRELTKKFEEVRGGPLQDLAAEIRAQPVKGEIVLLVDRSRGVREIFFDDMLKEALGEMTLKDAVAHVVRETGLKRRKIYQRALEMIRENGA